MNNYIEFLVMLRKKYDLFSIEKAACEAGVTSQTVRNFEKGVSKNSKLIMFYVRALYQELHYNTDYQANRTGISKRRIKADVDELIDGFLGKEI